jgi:predicted SnoaL-like aldol condensation-catalyzing enzyme
LTARDIVDMAMTEAFERGDAAAVGRFWSESYVEHSAWGQPGRAGLRARVGGLPPGFRYERVRTLGSAGLVVSHGVYHGLSPAPVVGCDLWRVEDDRIAEHWDARQPWAAPTPSGHTMIDGPASVTEPDKTGASRKLVQDFVALIMMGGDRSQLPRFFDGNRFVQHNPLIADGVSGLGEAIRSGIWAAVIERCHHVVADGEFVFTLGEGVLHGKPAAFCDLFRVEDDHLAEHWDVVYHIPAVVPHENGLF